MSHCGKAQGTAGPHGGKLHVHITPNDPFLLASLKLRGDERYDSREMSLYLLDGPVSDVNELASHGKGQRPVLCDDPFVLTAEGMNRIAR